MELDLKKLRSLFNENIGDLFIKYETLSTNDNAKNLAIGGGGDFTVVITEKQSAGRGQHGRAFVSEPGGLYMSVITARGFKAQKAPFLTLAAAVAVMKAVREISGLSPQIKWVNDVLIDGKKICGILTESRTLPNENTLDFAVIGIGLNVNTASFPSEIADTAVSLFTATGRTFDLNVVAAAVINALYDEISHFEDGEFVKTYRDNLIDPAPAQNLKF
jgi:BirA family biotin operon repressor/biotin-[acetyl-CoA-carboxylase] ligase